MGGESIRKAFNLDLEPDSVRERYGKNRWGQSVLLARRLVEAKVPMIQVNWTRFTSEPAGSPSWDTHSKNAENVKNRLMPVLDQSYTALLEDLELRGLLDETLVIWAGEFGRTPKHNGNAGRDHWGHVFSAALAGGGIQGGQIIGSSDKNGAYVKDSPIRPQDLHATMYTLMGIPLDTEILDLQGRPMPICRGQAIKGAI
jgi:arylsulfatase A-like enzyme